ncbi:DinB family protein [Anaerolineales bacterium HSG6]|nr:DinB family protein [Anaerolineales bacterium HSG6]
MMDSYRKLLNQQQTELRKVMMDFGQHNRSIALFLNQHAQLHSAMVSDNKTRSYEDEILAGMTEAQIRSIPQNREHSIAWCLWHIARVEDVTMNLLVAGQPQILQNEQWLERLQIPNRDTGNEMTQAQMEVLSSTINLTALRAYRVAVGRKTRAIVTQLKPEYLKEKVDPVRANRVRDEGAVVEIASDIADYWRKRNIAGLLLMPATRHNLVHLNEAARLKEKQT